MLEKPLSVLHLAEGKVSADACGKIGHRRVDDFDGVLTRMLSLGDTLYRGSIPSNSGFRISQVRDPFGNLVGLEGTG